MEILFFPFFAFITVPPLALVPAVLFGLCFRRHRPCLTRAAAIWVLATALSWLAYTAYESAVWVWSQDVINPIRVDLLLIAPALYLFSLLAVLACWKARRQV